MEAKWFLLYKIDKTILSRAFNLTKPIAKQPSIGGFSLPNNRYVIISLTKVINTTKESKDSQQYSIYQQQLENNYAELLLKESINHFHKLAKIKRFKHPDH